MHFKSKFGRHERLLEGTEALEGPAEPGWTALSLLTEGVQIPSEQQVVVSFFPSSVQQQLEYPGLDYHSVCLLRPLNECRRVWLANQFQLINQLESSL